jgi:hypothetical protein
LASATKDKYGVLPSTQLGLLQKACSVCSFAADALEAQTKMDAAAHAATNRERLKSPA